jgi:hypothetical protein
MNVEIGAEAALFPEKEYINGIFVAVHKPGNPLQLKVYRRRFRFLTSLQYSLAGWKDVRRLPQHQPVCPQHSGGECKFEE